MAGAAGEAAVELVSSAEAMANPKAAVRAMAMVIFNVFIGLFKMRCRDKTPKSAKRFKHNLASPNLPPGRPCDTLEA